MRRIKGWKAVAGVVALSLAVAACGGDDGDSSSEGGESGGEATTQECETTTPVKLQLQWFIQAQFAGYFAAIDQGYYAAQCLDVTIVEGGVDIVPQQQLADGAVDFALSWVPKALASREAGADIVNIAQVFQRSGTLQVSFKDKGIASPADFAGKKIGNWGFGTSSRSSPLSPRPVSIRRPTSSWYSSSSTWRLCSPVTSTPLRP